MFASVAVVVSALAHRSAVRRLRGGSTAVKAVVCDIDGTLFSWAGRVLSAGNARALQKCVDAGVTVSIATGRIPGPWVQTVRDAIPNGALGPCVYGNGCIVVDANNNPLWEAQLPSDVLRRVLEFTRGGVAGPGGARLSVLAATRWEGELRYCELAPGGAPSEVAALIDRAGEPPAVRFETLDGFEARDVVKFVMWTQQDDGWAHMPSTVEALRGVLDGTDATILDHGEKFCEVLPPGVNKGAGVARLCEALGVAPAEILACGDAENDVEMLQMAGVGAAMGDAKQAAIEAADVVVAANAEDGVADAIERFVFGGKS